MAEHRRVRTPAAVVLAGALALAAGGCATLPTGGPVRSGVQDTDVDRPGVRAVVPGPRDGQSPAAVLDGFLLSVAGDDLAVARDYLTEGAAAAWRPTGRTVVYADEPQVRGLPESGGPGGGGDPVEPEEDLLDVALDLDVVAILDGGGRYDAADPGTHQRVDVRLRRVADGRWRVAALPDLLPLSQGSFERLELAVPLYFPDVTGRFLVPDLRWFPQRTSLATTVVDALLAGPSAWLAPATRTVTPPGTALSLDAVAVGDGVARVDLTDEVLDSSPGQRAVLQAQLDATLQPLPDIGTVQVLVDGTELAQPQRTELERDPLVEGPPVVLDDGSVARLVPGGPTPLADVPTADGQDPGRLAASPEPGLFGVLTDGRSRLRLLRAGAQESGDTLLGAPDLTAPSFDRFGFVWSTAASSSGSVTVARVPSGSATPDEEPAGVVEASAPWLEGRRVLAMRVSRDGARVVVLSRGPEGGVSVQVAAVERDTDRAPERLVVAPGGSLLPSVTDAVDVTWLDDTTLAVLADGAQSSEVVVASVVGPASTTSSPGVLAESLTAARGEQSLLLGTADGEVLERAGAGWSMREQAAGTRWPAYPG